MTKVSPLVSAEQQEDDAWLRFLLDEALEVLAAYRSIRDPEIRKMHVRMMQESARAEKNKDKDIN